MGMGGGEDGSGGWRCVCVCVCWGGDERGQNPAPLLLYLNPSSRLLNMNDISLILLLFNFHY